MGRQWNQIIESLGPLTGGTVSINANLGDIDALLTTLQADVADGITVSSGTVTANVASILDPDNTVQAAVENGIGGSPLGYSIGLVNDTIPNNAIQIGFADEVTGNFQAPSNTYPLPVTETSSTSGGTGPTTFTSTTYGTIKTGNTSRKGLTIYNEGTGNLHITLGTATTSTSSYTVKLATGDYYELPFKYTGLVGGIFATAGTARVTEIT